MGGGVLYLACSEKKNMDDTLGGRVLVGCCKLVHKQELQLNACS